MRATCRLPPSQLSPYLKTTIFFCSDNEAYCNMLHSIYWSWDCASRSLPLRSTNRYSHKKLLSPRKGFSTIRLVSWPLDILGISFSQFSSVTGGLCEGDDVIWRLTSRLSFKSHSAPCSYIKSNADNQAYVIAISLRLLDVIMLNKRSVYRHCLSLGWTKSSLGDPATSSR